MIIKWGIHEYLKITYLMFDIDHEPNRSYYNSAKQSAIHHTDGVIFNTRFSYLSID